MRIYKEFQIEAAHLLPNLSEHHKCHRLHGHSFRIKVYIEGAIQDTTGWIMDFAEISEAFKPVFESLDHHYLNDIEGLENPTNENLAKWIWQKLIKYLPVLVTVEVQETCTSGCIYDGNG